MTAQDDEPRRILHVTGNDAEKFLQDLVTNDITKAKEGLVYTALLTPQGKFLFDFFIQGDATNGYLIDVDAGRAAALAARLGMYKLRADVEIEASDLQVFRGLRNPPEGSVLDPRSDALGWRHYAKEGASGEGVDWTAIRVQNLIPLSGAEILPDETFILEAGFERLNGVDFKKGCYVGQEVTARMKHKTDLRKGFEIVTLAGSVPFGTEITCNGKAVGWVASQSGSKAIAYLRFDRAKEGMVAGDVAVMREG